MPNPYISPATLAHLCHLDAEASPPPLYQETAYVMTDQGIERRYMAVVRPVDVELALQLRLNMRAMIREIRDGRGPEGLQQC